MRIVSHVASNTYSYSSGVPLLAAPPIAGLLPSSNPIPQSKVSLFKHQDLTIEPPIRTPRRLPPHIQAAFEAAQDRLIASFAEVDAEVALLRQRYGVAERRSRYGC